MSDDVLELLKTVPAPPMSVDPYAAMAAGRRARVRRRRLVTVAAAVAVLSVATGSVLVAADRNGALPARPSPPSPSPSAAPRSLTAQFEAPGQGLLIADLDPAATTITVRRSGDRLGGPGLAVPVPPSPGAAACRMSPVLLVQACAVRAPVRDGIMGYIDPTSGAAAGFPVVGRFSVPDVSVVVVSASADDLPSLRGAVWDLDDGTVADSSGTAVPQTHGRVVPVEVFASTLAGSFYLGLRPDSTDGWVASGPGDFGETPYTGMGDATGDYYAYVLPAAAVSGEVQPPISATVRSQEILVLAGRKVLVAQLTGVKRFSGPNVEWVDKDGGVHALP